MPPGSLLFDLKFWKKGKEMFYDTSSNLAMTPFYQLSMVLLVFTTKPITSFLGSLFGWGGLWEKKLSLLDFFSSWNFRINGNISPCK